jgi:hypothetical protein
MDFIHTRKPNIYRLNFKKITVNDQLYTNTEEMNDQVLI